MAKWELKAGASIETLTRDELSAELGPLKYAAAQGLKAPTTMRAPFIVTTDASGTITATVIWKCPVGQRARVHRVSVGSPAYTPGSAYSPAGGWLTVSTEADGSVPDWMLPEGSSPAIIPAVMTATSDAPYLLDGEGLILKAGGLAAALQINGRVLVELWPTELPRILSVTDA